MTRHLTIALMTLILSVSILAVASVSISPALPDVNICNNFDVDGNADTAGYAYTNAFDFVDYVDAQGVAPDAIQWKFDSQSNVGTGGSSILTVNGKASGTADLTNTAGTVDTMATFGVTSDPTDTTLATEVVAFQATTGYTGSDDTVTDTVTITYQGTAGQDSISGEVLETQDWSAEGTTGWATANVYSAGLPSYGDGSFDGVNSSTPAVSGETLDVTLAQSEYVSFLWTPGITVTAGGQYIVKVPVSLSATASGTGAASYPVLRLLAIYDQNGIKAPDTLCYEGAVVASGSSQDYYVAFTAESASETFQVRIDTLNCTSTTFTASYGDVTIASLSGLSSPVFTEDWADTTGWSVANVYTAGLPAYGEGEFDGVNSNALPTPAAGEISSQIAENQYISLLNSAAVSAEAGGVYVIQIEAKMDATQGSPVAAAAYPVLRLLAIGNGNGAGLVAPDCLMYEGYPAASGSYVTYSVAFKSETAQSFDIRMDAIGCTTGTPTVNFKAINVYKYQ